jgi:inner membrane protein
MGPLLGYLLWNYYQRRDDLSAWIGLGVWTLVGQSILSLFTVYGTQLLAPFSDHRFALSAIPAVDPIYTIMLLAAVVFGFIYHRRTRDTIIAAWVALTLTTAYLFFGLAQNENAYLYARNQLTAEGIPNADVRVYPTMYQIFLRRVVVHFPNEVWVGFISTWTPHRIPWNKQPQAPIQIRQAILNHPYGKIYNWFTSDEMIFRPHRGDPYRWDMLDSRFGFAGNTMLGISGRTVSVDANGKVYDDFNSLQIPHEMHSHDYKALLYAAFGKHYVPTAP